MARNLFIPPLGTEITLAEDWTFDLHNEPRNETLLATMGVEFKLVDCHVRSAQCRPVTLPAGSVLKVDRLYVKKGQGAFDSVTFYLKGHARPSYIWMSVTGRQYKMPKKPVRFWVKLHDANKIVMEE